MTATTNPAMAARAIEILINANRLPGSPYILLPPRPRLVDIPVQPC
jgi:hypothetical protein